MKTILTTIMGLIMLTQLTAQSPTAIPAKPEVVFVQGGTFRMGSSNGSKDESPVHSVTINDFSIGKYEVTVGQYKAFCNEAGRSMPKTPKWGWQDRHPMVNVNYDDAVAYCNWLSEKYDGNWRLPTEAEWEYAARGGNKSNGYTYSGSNNLEPVGWFQENSNPHTQDVASKKSNSYNPFFLWAQTVGSKKPNELGIYDMSGNASEWCSDWYSENYYASSPSSNPQGPSSGSNRVMRGGCWILSAWTCRVAKRSHQLPIIGGNDTCGFRVVLSQ